MTEGLLTSVLAAAVVAGTPLLYAALGELIAERAGVLNLGVEGMMLVGAVAGFMTAVRSGSLLAAVTVAAAAGGAVACVHALLCVGLRANQVVSGLALTLFGTGLSAYLGKSMIGVPTPVVFEPVVIPVLGAIPVLGPALFRHDALVYASYLLVPAAWWGLYRTRPGLHLRAVGENPAAADAAGLGVFAWRYLATAAGGMLAGVGGAYLSLAYAPSWIENMTAGRGWIAVALVIFATWHPLRAMAGAYLFGGVDALGFRIQSLGLKSAGTLGNPFILSMLPYLFTIVVLIAVTGGGARRRLGAPGALGLAYHREER